MNTEVLIFLPIAISLLCYMVEGTIMCSTCLSNKEFDCESSPPKPQPCTESGSGVTEACSTIRIFKTPSGELHQFIRSCSSSPSQTPECFDHPPGYRTCAQICYTDGCNSATLLVVLPRTWFFLWILLITKLYNC